MRWLGRLEPADRGLSRNPVNMFDPQSKYFSLAIVLAPLEIRLDDGKGGNIFRDLYRPAARGGFCIYACVYWAERQVNNGVGGESVAMKLLAAPALRA